MKASHLLSFLGGAALALGVSSMVTSSRAAASNHVFELRMYHTKPGKLQELHARFRDHTDAIFKKHNMKSVGYWMPETDQPNSNDLFIYVLEHPSRQEGEKNWAAFQADPEWVKAKAASEVNGLLVDHVDRFFMDPAPFSALK